MMLSGVWFSVEAAGEPVKQIASIFPLTHILRAARSVMLDGAGITEILPQLAVLVAMSAVFLTAGALVFRWGPR